MKMRKHSGNLFKISSFCDNFSLTHCLIYQIANFAVTRKDMEITQNAICVIKSL